MTNFWDSWTNTGRWNNRDRRPTSPPTSLKLNTRYADCNWCKPLNTKNHRTDDYIRTDNSLVVRRGQLFKFTARLNREFDSKTDVIKIDLQYGARPSQLNGTRIIVEEKTDQTGWYLTIDKIIEKRVTCSIHPPANALVGRYKCSIYLETGNDRAVDEEPDIIVLCNPWCPEDDVYLPSPAECNEYVLNDSGYIWQGTSKKSDPLAWDFGQFEDKILDTALYLIMNDRRIQKGLAKRGLGKLNDPLWLSRIISAGANSHDDAGVVAGNWSGDFTGGTAPVTWNGSVKIIQQFADTKQPVKFGQCWVYSGVTTTLLRALGIPARSVTNFSSAHDQDNTMTIDKYIHHNTNENLGGRDSIWNFHVWNEVWLKGAGHWEEKYAGWAAIDATPQEESNGLMQLGPAPVKAIKEGEIFVGYDGGFVFGEVNADHITWLCKQESNMIVVQSMGRRIKGAVGFNISTKAVGSNERHVLTHDYKYPEGSKDERRAWDTAFQQCNPADYFTQFLDHDEAQIKTDISLTPKHPTNGEDFTVNVKVTNLNDHDIAVNVKSFLFSCFYTGQRNTFISKDDQEDQSIPANAEETISFLVAFEDYQHRFSDDHMSMKVETMIQIVSVDKTFTDFLDFQMTNPHGAVSIEFSSPSGTIGQTIQAKVSFTNPLPIPLTELVISLEGTGLLAPTSQSLSGSIPAHGEAVIAVMLIPTRTGLRRLMVDIDAKEQKDFKGENTIQISKP